MQSMVRNPQSAMSRLTGAITLGLLLLPSPARADFFVGPGATGSTFLKVPMSARATALGGSFTGVSGDVTALEYNPAGLVGMNRPDFRLTYLSYLEDTSLHSALIGFPIGVGPHRSSKNLAATRDTLSIGFQYRMFSADDVGRSEIGAKLDEFAIRDVLFQVAAAYPLTPRLSVGVAGKHISNKIQDRSATNLAADAGLQLRLSPRWSAGASVLNVGGAKALETEKDPLPTQVRVGAARQADHWLLAADAATGRDKINRFSGGVEVELGPYVRLRGGAVHHTTFEVTGGLGIEFNGPQKAPHGALASRSRRSSDEDADDAEAISKKTAIMANSLINQLELPADAPAPMLLAVLPLSSNDRSAEMLTELLTYHFTQAKKFEVMERSELLQAMEDRNLQPSSRIDPAMAVKLGRKLGAHYVVVGSAERVNSKLHVNARVVEVANALILATSTQAIGIAEEGSGRKRLASAPDTRPQGPGFTSVNIGLDYSASSNDELGFSHNITLRILY